MLADAEPDIQTTTKEEIHKTHKVHHTQVLLLSLKSGVQIITNNIYFDLR